MEVNQFYTFGTSFLKTPLGFECSDNRWEYQLKLIRGNYEGAEFPITFKQTSGKKIVDIFNYTTSGLLVSDNFISLLEKNNFTGWKTFPVKLFTKAKTELTGYNGFSVTGKSGDYNYSKSEIIEKRFVPEGPIVRMYKQLDPGLDKWDGKDFFMGTRGAGIFITERVKNILVKNKITNLQFINLADYEYAHPELQK